MFARSAGGDHGAATAEAQNSASIQATATVLSALTVAAGQNLLFGNVTPGVNKTIAITDAGAGTFTVTKAATSGVTLSFTLPTNLASGTDLLPIGSWSGAWNTSASTAGANGFTPSAAGSNTSVTAQAYQATAGVLRPLPGVGIGTASGGFPDGTNARRAQISLRLSF